MSETSKMLINVYICNKKYSAKDVRERDHCHITGKNRGSAHQDCNINYRLTDIIIYRITETKASGQLIILHS